MNTGDLTTLALERAALAAWPAADVVDVDGWKLRAMHGITRRANSAWTAQAHGTLSLGERLRRTEAFYAERRQDCIVHVTPLSPPELDSELEQRGYAIDAPVSVQTAALNKLLTEPMLPAGARVERTWFDAWWEVSVRRGRYAAVPDHFGGLLQRLGDRALYAVAELQGETAAVGLGVVDGEWLGVFGMHTLPLQRRRGLGSRVIRALAHSARDLGVTKAYLQVERDNVGALALYRHLGFVEHYSTHYRLATVPS